MSAATLTALCSDARRYKISASRTHRHGKTPCRLHDIIVWKPARFDLTASFHRRKPRRARCLTGVFFRPFETLVRFERSLTIRMTSRLSNTFESRHQHRPAASGRADSLASLLMPPGRTVRTQRTIYAAALMRERQTGSEIHDTSNSGTGSNTGSARSS